MHLKEGRSLSLGRAGAVNITYLLHGLRISLASLAACAMCICR